MHTHDPDCRPLIERRQSNDVDTLLHIQEIQGHVKDLTEKMAAHHSGFREEVEKAVERVYVSAFPDGDPTGHRLHHELVMRREEERLEFWKEMRTAGAKWLGLGVLGFVATAVWIAIKTEAHK